MSRSSSDVLSEAPEDESDKMARLRAIRGQADQAYDLLSSGDISALGSLIGEAWYAKRGISASVSGGELDALHDRIMSMGANGAKLLGAGGGGFFLVHGSPSLREELANLGVPHRLIPLDIDWTGSEIIHNG